MKNILTPSRTPYLLLGLFLLFQCYLFFIHPFLIQDYWRYVNNFPQPLVEDREVVSQTFRSPGPLSRIDILLANYKKKPSGGTLQLEIFKKQKPLFKGNYPANTVEDNQFYRFPITPPKKIPGGSYRLQLKYFPENPNEKLAAWIWTTPKIKNKKDIYPHGKLYVNRKPRNADLTFRVYYRATLFNRLGPLLDKIPTSWGAHFWLGFGFVLALFMINYFFFYLSRYFFPRSNQGPTPTNTEETE